MKFLVLTELVQDQIHETLFPYVSTQQRVQLKGKNVILRTKIRYYLHSDIKSLGTLNSRFPVLLHTQLTLHSTSDNQGCHKTVPFNALAWPHSPRQTNHN